MCTECSAAQVLKLEAKVAEQRAGAHAAAEAAQVQVAELRVQAECSAAQVLELEAKVGLLPQVEPDTPLPLELYATSGQRHPDWYLRSVELPPQVEPDTPLQASLRQDYELAVQRHVQRHVQR